MSMFFDHELSSKECWKEDIIRRVCRGKVMLTGTILRLECKRLLWKTVIGGTKVVKRGVDILLSSVALLALAPVFVVVALLIRLESSGPALFRQTRVGRWGKPFSFWKLRSMYIDAEQRKAARHRRDGDVQRGWRHICAGFGPRADPRSRVASGHRHA